MEQEIFATREKLEQEVNDILIPGIKEFVNKAHAKGVILGISGGIDSAVVATLCVKALGDFWVKGVYMPCHSDLEILPSDDEKQDHKDAYDLAKWLGIEIDTLDLTTPFIVLRTRLNLLNRTSDGTVKEITPAAAGNVKARMRMVSLYALKEDLNYLCVGTGNKTEISIGYFCYDDQTRVLTKNGLKYFTELSKDDMVFSMNLDTKMVEETGVKELYKFEFDGMMRRGLTRGIDFKVTGNHRMVLQNVHNNKKCFLSMLDLYLENHDRMDMAIPEGFSSKIQTDKIGDFETNDLMYLYGLFIGDGCCTTSEVKYCVKSEKCNRDAVTGRFEKTKNPINKKVVYPVFNVIFSVPKENKNSAWYKLTNILDKYGIKWHETNCGIKVSLSDRSFYDIFTECGKYAKNKVIPTELLSYSTENLKYLYYGLMDSDGDKNGNYYTISKRLAEQIVELSFKIGRSASIHNIKERVSYYKGKKIVSSPSYCVSSCRKIKSRTVKREKVNDEYYKGFVWCPEVEKNSNLLVERNGKFYFCGNTKYGDGGVDFEPIGEYYKTEVRILADILGIKDAVPNTVSKAPSARLTPGQTDEGDIGATYREIDTALWNIENSQRGEEDKLDLKKRLMVRCVGNKHKCNAPPSILRQPVLWPDGNLRRW